MKSVAIEIYKGFTQSQLIVPLEIVLYFIPSSGIYYKCQKILMKKMDNYILDEATNKNIHTLIVNLFYYLSERNKDSKSKKKVNKIAL